MDELIQQVQRSEKITINLNVVELGYIDMLVNEGHYSNRTDFIKASVRKQLDLHSKETNKLLEKKEQLGYEYTIGVGGFTLSELENMKNEGRKKKVIFVGVFYLAKGIDLTLLEDTIESIKVYGISKCSDEVKKRYNL